MEEWSHLLVVTSRHSRDAADGYARALAHRACQEVTHNLHAAARADDEAVDAVADLYRRDCLLPQLMVPTITEDGAAVGVVFDHIRTDGSEPYTITFIVLHGHCVHCGTVVAKEVHDPTSYHDAMHVAHDCGDGLFD